MASTVSHLALTLPRDRSRQAAPQVFDLLRDAIINLDLVPGTVLSRPELQLQFSLSSTPIRDALMRLAEEALVDIFPQHATVVSRIDLGHARQAAFLRRSIEVEVVHNLASSPDAALLEKLQQNLRQQQALADSGALLEFNAIDRDMHRMMYDAAGVPDLWTVMLKRNGHIERLRRLHLPMKGKVDQTIRDHIAIVEAIAAGDPAQAAKEVRAHLSRSLAFIEGIRAHYPAEYFRD